MTRTVGFACTTIFHYVHFRRIAEQFGEESIYIISTPRFMNDRYEKLAEYLRSQHVIFCDSADIIAGKIKVKAVVAPYYMPLFNFIDPSIYRIRTIYGYAKDAWNYANWNKGFDLIFAYGPYSQRMLESKAPTISIGHPRYKGTEARLNHEVYSIGGESLTAWLSADNRQTLLYSPTWGDLSSFNWFKDAINGLLKEYKIIVKLHHLISLTNEYDFKSLTGKHLFLCDESVDLFDLFPVTELVISDYSGAIFDAILANKRLILVNSLTQSVADTGVLNINRLSNIANVQEDNINVAGSLDIQMRNYLPSVDEPRKLVEAVDEYLKKPIIDYKEINEDLYSHMDDQTPSRAYQEIERLLQGGTATARKLTAKDINFKLDVFNSYVEDNCVKPFVIWGAGAYGQLIIEWLLCKGIAISAILDTNHEKHGKMLYSIPITSPKDYKFDDDERLIISFAFNDKYELTSLLSNMGLKDPARWIEPF